jgi:hypothetical protein
VQQGVGPSEAFLPHFSERLGTAMVGRSRCSFARALNVEGMRADVFFTPQKQAASEAAV